jgi:putative Mg2+ transporter-C (MgtC) family protein
MTWEIAGQIVLSLAIGGATGLERELRTGIGLRTLMLVCLGSTLFTLYGEEFSLESGDPRRIAGSVVAAVGFLGAGMILSVRTGIFGFTTAASVWLVAALGMGIGIGEYGVAGLSAALVLAVLWLIPYLRQVTNASQAITYEALGPPNDVRREQLITLMGEHGLKILRSTMSKSDEGILYTWQALGRSDKHHAAQLALLENPIVREFRVMVFDELN